MSGDDRSAPADQGLAARALAAQTRDRMQAVAQDQADIQRAAAEAARIRAERDANRT